MKKRIIFGCALVCGAIAAVGAAPYALTVERLADPCGVDAAAPRLGWKMAAKHGVKDVTQSAYRVLVATSREKLADDEGDLWDSGKVPGSQAIDIAYAGKPLASSRSIWWKVRTWDAKDAASDWSLPGQWVTGIMPSDGWKAKWIGPAPETRPAVDHGTEGQEGQGYASIQIHFRRYEAGRVRGDGACRRAAARRARERKVVPPP